jgi:ABC-type polysaccharide/polyol phosphate transport system ATPase subunit
VVLDKTRELAKSNVTVIMISHSETVPQGVTNTVTVTDKGLTLQ